MTSTATLAAKQMPPRPKIVEADIEENFLKGSGPGGQKIVCGCSFPYYTSTTWSKRRAHLTLPPSQNKTASAVQLLHKPTGIVMKSQATRSRTQNRKIARQLLAEKLEVMEKGEDSRKRIKEGVASKKKRSKDKKARRKYRKLAEEKAGGGVGGAVVEEGEEDDEEDGEDGDEDEEDEDEEGDEHDSEDDREEAIKEGMEEGEDDKINRDQKSRNGRQEAAKEQINPS